MAKKDVVAICRIVADEERPTFGFGDEMLKDRPWCVGTRESPQGEVLFTPARAVKGEAYSELRS
jgi:hypothetical protein